MAEFAPEIQRFVALRRQARRATAAFQRSQATFTAATTALRAAQVELANLDSGVRTHVRPEPKTYPDTFEGMKEERAAQLWGAPRETGLQPRIPAAERAAAREKIAQERERQRAAIAEKIALATEAVEAITVERDEIGEDAQQLLQLLARCEAYLRARKIKIPVEGPV